MRSWATSSRGPGIAIIRRSRRSGRRIPQPRTCGASCRPTRCTNSRRAKRGQLDRAESRSADMRTALEAPASMLDEHETKFVAKIREHGWFHMSVARDAEGPGFGYTTGFWLKFDFPELITFSLKRDTAHDIFWGI